MSPEEPKWGKRSTFPPQFETTAWKKKKLRHSLCGRCSKSHSPLWENCPLMGKDARWSIRSETLSALSLSRSPPTLPISEKRKQAMARLWDGWMFGLMNSMSVALSFIRPSSWRAEPYGQLYTRAWGPLARDYTNSVIGREKARGSPSSLSTRSWMPEGPKKFDRGSIWQQVIMLHGPSNIVLEILKRGVFNTKLGVVIINWIGIGIGI